MIWWIVTVASVLINLGCIWYIRELLIRFSYVGGATSEISSLLEHYHDHLEAVYELPTFYGDNTLSELLKHTSDTKEEMRFYKEIFSLTNPETKTESVEEPDNA